jgi:tetratricopeptide (TPR) repeat protein
MHHRRRFTSAIGLLSLVFALQPFALRADTSAGTPSDQLGKVNFPTSCSADVQPTIEKAVALLHSFQYKESEQTFADASARDPKCPMAHWGTAMALYHQLWDFPDDKTLKEGHKDIEQARIMGAPTERERGYIAATAAFYQDNSKFSPLERRQAYSAALAQLHAQSPDDVDAAAFYALSLVALAEEGHARASTERKTAIAILEPLCQIAPNNPGPAHYLIHATDLPEFASLGLEAARNYAKIAPDSSHALHMPSHIFVRLGLWQESIASNLAAAASAAKATEEHRADPHYQFHALDFLDYSYLQGGEQSKAQELLEELKNVPGASAEDIIGHAGEFLARHALELHQWRQAATLPIPAKRRDSQEAVYKVRAIGAAHRGHAAAARVYLQKYIEARESQRQDTKQDGYGASLEKSVTQLEAEAWIAYAEGKFDEGLKTLRSAADREDADGVDSLAMPAREMLGDMLLELKRPAEALAEYKTSLKNSPNRFDGLFGAARAAQALGDAASAQSYFAKLAEACPPGADRPELAEAKTVLAAHTH